jgi:ABC-type transport system involved in multi-copper enzyme maturation permease subunit
MFWLLVERELKSIILSPKFVATFGVCSLLMVLSLFIGIQEYNYSQRKYETAIQLTERRLQAEDSWWGIRNTVYRKPDAMQVFVSGVDYDVGRLSQISTWTEVKLQNSAYSDDSLFAVFRFVDFTFIVQVVLSLFAILFTYDAINGERESGTLKLALSNAVPRARFLLAKFIGSWIGLTVPILIPMLLAVLTVILLGIPMSGDGWAKLGTLLVVSVLYFTFFIALGILVSSLTRHSAVSFLILLVTWVALVLIIPRAATMAAGQLVHVDSVAEVDTKKDRYSTDRWLAHREQRRDLNNEREQAMASMTDEQERAYRDANRALWLQEDEDLRQVTREEIGEYGRRLDEGRNNQKTQMQEVAFTMSRFSPSSAYQIATMSLAGTNVEMKSRYETAMHEYHVVFTKFVNGKRHEERLQNQGRGHRSRDEADETLDLSELPRFQSPRYPYREAFGPTVVDIGLLMLYSLVAFAGAFVAFLRYDVR